jgi:iron complex transport system ATP-binding protein
MNAVSVHELSVHRDSVRVLTDVCFDVAAGSWLGVIGPNGAGKSTLLHALSGVLPFSGTVQLHGDDVTTLARRARAQRIALVPQAPSIPSGITVTEYVGLGRAPHRGALAAETAHDYAVVTEVLDSLDLVALAGRPLTTLSGGECQRAVIARALAQQSSIVLLDEPTASLDLGHQLDVLNLVDRLRRDRDLTIVTTLHDLTLAGRYPDMLLLIAGGRVVAYGSPIDVLTPAVIERHYGIGVRIMCDETGIVVVPTRRLEAS